MVNYKYIIGTKLIAMDASIDQQNETDTEMRDVSIDPDPDGLNREMGNELDLIALYEINDSLELEIITEVFEAGAAYGANAGAKNRY